MRSHFEISDNEEDPPAEKEAEKERKSMEKSEEIKGNDEVPPEKDTYAISDDNINNVDRVLYDDKPGNDLPKIHETIDTNKSNMFYPRLSFEYLEGFPTNGTGLPIMGEDTEPLGQIPKYFPKSKDILWFPKSIERKHIFKMDKYIFPKTLPESPKVKNYSNLEIIGFLVNLSKNRIPVQMFNKWNNITGRDLSSFEIYPSGIVKSKYGLKKDREIYKKINVKKAEDIFTGNLKFSTSAVNAGKVNVAKSPKDPNITSNIAIVNNESKDNSYQAKPNNDYDNDVLNEALKREDVLKVIQTLKNEDDPIKTRLSLQKIKKGHNNHRQNKKNRQILGYV